MKLLNRLIVDFAYYINGASRYQNVRRFIYNLLESDKYIYKRYFDIFMIVLIFFSVAILIVEVKSEIPEEIRFFNAYIVSIIFFIEYLLRFWVSSSVTQIIINRSEYDAMLGREFKLSKALLKIIKTKLEFVLSFKAIVDLLAVLPFFHELRLLRLFVLFRIFKLFRYTKRFQIFISVLSTKKFEFFILFMFSSIVIFVSSVLVYVMEAHNPQSPINTLFDALYWSIVTIAAVGYGDIVTVTVEGRIVALFVIITGISVLAFTTSIVVSAFGEKLDEIREIKTIDDIRKFKHIYLICGYESVAAEVARKLKSDRMRVVVLDESPSRIEKAKNDGLVVLNYDPGNIDSYRKLGIDLNTQVRSVLCLRESDVENVYTTLTIRAISKNVNITSLLMDEINRKKLLFAGVNEIIYPKGLVGLIAKELIGRPVAFEVIHALRNDYYGVNVEELVISDRINENIKNVGMLKNDSFKVLLLGVYKKEQEKFLFNPNKDTKLQSGDYLLVIGQNSFIKEFDKYLHKKSLA